MHIMEMQILNGEFNIFDLLLQNVEPFNPSRSNSGRREKN